MQKGDLNATPSPINAGTSHLFKKVLAFVGSMPAINFASNGNPNVAMSV